MYTLESFVTKAQYELSFNFGLKRAGLDKREYLARNPTADDIKLLKDVTMGAIGEFGFYNYIVSQGGHCTVPDTTWYPKDKKSYKHDLVFWKAWGAHVKAIYMCNTYRTSGLFQEWDKAMKHPDGMMFILCKGHTTWATYDKPRDIRVDIMCCTPMKSIHAHKLLKEPQKQSIRGNKKAVYLEDIQRLPIDEWFGPLSPEVAGL